MTQRPPASATPPARTFANPRPGSTEWHREQFELAQYVKFLQRKAASIGKGTKDNSTDRLTISAPEPILNQMVDNELDATFAALADPTRRGMLASLQLGERSIGQLAEPFAMSLAGASKHVAVLEKAGLVERRKAGRQQLCRLRAAPLREADQWLRQWETMWTTSLDKLEALIATDKAK